MAVNKKAIAADRKPITAYKKSIAADKKSITTSKKSIAAYTEIYGGR